MAATGKFYESICAVCCYYKGEGSYKIICEGLYPQCNLHMTFPSSAAKERHQEEFCYTHNYEECPIAQMLTPIAEARADEEAELAKELEEEGDSKE